VLPRPPLDTALELGLAGCIALLYVLSDFGLLDVPHPTLMSAVPVTWWRKWRPYRASLLYGAALGLGVTTRIPFGAFYVLCILSFLHGNVLYGAALMATYGSARTLAVMWASWVKGSREIDSAEWLSIPFCDVRRMRGVASSSLLATGALLVSAALVAIA
jgi:hypothetical protein